MKLNKFISVVILAFSIAGGAYGQVAPVRGEVSAGVYENIKSTNQALNVNMAAGLTSTAVFTTTTPTITNSSTTALAANASRKSVMIQNNDAAGIVYLNFTTTATSAHFKLGPGQSLMLSGIVPVDAIRAIGSIASNANVVVVEGQ